MLHSKLVTNCQTEFDKDLMFARMTGIPFLKLHFTVVSFYPDLSIIKSTICVETGASFGKKDSES